MEILWNTILNYVNSTDISMQHITFVLRVEEKAKQRTIMNLYLPYLFFNPEDEGSIFLRNIKNIELVMTTAVRTLNPACSQRIYLI
jgi:hypothetical protein